MLVPIVMSVGVHHEIKAKKPYALALLQFLKMPESNSTYTNTGGPYRARTTFENSVVGSHTIGKLQTCFLVFKSRTYKDQTESERLSDERHRFRALARPSGIITSIGAHYEIEAKA